MQACIGQLFSTCLRRGCLCPGGKAAACHFPAICAGRCTLNPCRGCLSHACPRSNLSSSICLCYTRLDCLAFQTVISQFGIHGPQLDSDLKFNLAMSNRVQLNEPTATGGLFVR